MIAIVDYGMGNLRSVDNAFKVIGQKSKITNDPAELKQASAIVLPGVGAFGDGMSNLKRLNLIEVLNKEIIKKGKPFLGICLGLQFLAQDSQEFGHHPGLGWVKGKVKKIVSDQQTFKTPHMGWNNINILKRDPLFVGLEDEPVFYFVHSYYLEVEDESILSSVCWHGVNLTTSIQCNNIFGVQFHPEKSQKAGLKLLENFSKIL